MLKEKLQELGFDKIPNGRLMQCDDSLLYLVKADTNTMSFEIEEPNISKYIIERDYNNVFLLVQIGKSDKYFVMTLNNYDFGAFLRNKNNVPFWKFKFCIVPQVDEEYGKMVLIENKNNTIINNCCCEVLLDELDVLCILGDYTGTRI